MKLNIAYLPGDGIGPEIGTAALSVLEVLADKFGHELSITEGLIGGAAIDAAGTNYPAETDKLVKAADAVLLAAVGGPKWDHLPGPERPEMGLLGLRKSLGTFSNLRPARPHPTLMERCPIKPEFLKGTDILVVRELTGGIYFGDKGRRDDGTAFDVCTYSEAEVERIARMAFDVAEKRRGKVTSVDKSNVLETSRLWRAVVTEVAKDYPDVELEHMLVDAAAMHLLTRPTSFDVIVTENMFGDILTDEASVLCGSMGVIPSASLAESGKGLYEPIHGSAPDIAGQGKANPTGMLLSVAWMMRLSFGLEKEAAALEAAVDACLSAGDVTADLGGALSTSQMGEAVAAKL